MVEVIIKVVVAYLLGSLNGALIIGRFRGIDIRQEGSGNAGGTNALRTHGKGFAAGVVVIDVVKAWIAVLWLPALVLPGAGETPLLPIGWMTASCGAAAVIGHCWPVFFGFRGGKGMATLMAIYAVFAPLTFAVVGIVWLVVVYISGYVSLATILAAASAPVLLFFQGAGAGYAKLVFALAMALLILFTHRSNIARMRKGEEHRIKHALIKRGS